MNMLDVRKVIGKTRSIFHLRAEENYLYIQEQMKLKDSDLVSKYIGSNEPNNMGVKHLILIY